MNFVIDLFTAYENRASRWCLYEYVFTKPFCLFTETEISANCFFPSSNGEISIFNQASKLCGLSPKITATNRANIYIEAGA